MHAHNSQLVKVSAYRVDLLWGPRGVERYAALAEEDSGQWAWIADGDWEPFGGLLDHHQRITRALSRAYPSLRS